MPFVPLLDTGNQSASLNWEITRFDGVNWTIELTDRTPTVSGKPVAKVILTWEQWQAIDKVIHSLRNERVLPPVESKPFSPSGLTIGRKENPYAIQKGESEASAFRASDGGYTRADSAS